MISPKTIKEHLDLYVIGQEEAKYEVANYMYLHIAKTNYSLKYGDHRTGVLPSDDDFKNTNMMLMGPSGCGKTYILEKAAEFVGLPFFKINSKSLSNTGYVGTSIDKFLTTFKSECDNKYLFKYSIILIDEIDKICGGEGTGRHDGHEGGWYLGLQYSLLKCLEGQGHKPKSSGSESSYSTVDTGLMMFVFAGNFQEIRDKRDDVRIKPGFGASTESASGSDKEYFEELINYGVTRELVGRIGNVVEIHKLTEEDYFNILKHSKNSIINQYQRIIKYVNGSKIVIKDKELHKLARKCKDYDLGARGLTKVVSDYFKSTIITMKPINNPEELLNGLASDSYSGGSCKITIKEIK